MKDNTMSKQQKAHKQPKQKKSQKGLLFDTVAQELSRQLSQVDSSCSFILPPHFSPSPSPSNPIPPSYTINHLTSTPAVPSLRNSDEALSNSPSPSSSDRSNNVSGSTSSTSDWSDLAPGPFSHQQQVKLPSLAHLDDAQVIELLAASYGKVSHMVLLDRNYRVFVNQNRTGALLYQVRSRVAVVMGDPLCHPCLFGDILSEFKALRKTHHWGVAYLGCSEALVEYAHTQPHKRYTTMHFGFERVLDPMTNDVLMERSGKRIITQNKRLLHPAKGGLTLGVYIPSCGQDASLQQEMSAIYESWRKRRNQTRSAAPETFITVYNPFDFANLMIYLYARDAGGRVQGFAALRWMGANQGYHVDPCVAARGAPRGVGDLLIYAAMTFSKHIGSSYLSMGYEPSEALGEMSGMSPRAERLMRWTYGLFFRRLPLAGKKAYHDKFRPVAEGEFRLFLVFPSDGLKSLQQLYAVAHAANISICRLICTRALSETQAASAGEKTSETQSQSRARGRDHSPKPKE